MQHSPKNTAQKKSYTGFSLRQRLVPVILVSLALSLTVFIFGPFEIYGANADQFGFSLLDFIGWNLLCALGTTVIVCAILLPLRGRVFDIVFALFFWIALMLTVQGNYLNFGVSALTGDGTGADGFEVSYLILNCVIWGVVGIGCLLAVLLIGQKYREWIPTVCTIAMITVIGMQGITMAVTSMTSDVWAPTVSVTKPEDEEAKAIPHLLTYKNLDQVSSQNNVIWFVIDRFDVRFYEEAQKECPELFYNLDGFTYFNDMTSRYPRTFPSVAYMLTGVEHDFHDARSDYLTEAFANANFLKLLKENNYNVNIYTDQYYCYEDARALENYVSNSSKAESVEVIKKPSLSLDMTRLSLFRALPIAAKNTVGSISTSDFQKYIVYETEYPKYESADMKIIYDYLTDHPLTLTEEKNNFTFLHIAGCHLPNKYNENFEAPEKSDEWNSMVSMKQSFQIINLYIDQLKALGLYENATIIITGDHGSLQGSDTRLPTDPSYPNPILTALLVKESGSAGTPLMISSAPVMQADIIPTILRSERIMTDTDFGRSVFEISETEARTRKYNFQSYQKDSGGYEVIEYEIVGRARDLKNWTIVNRYMTESIYR